MAKTKQQKQEEALARKRKDFSEHMARYLRTQHGGEDYCAEVARVGATAAETFRINGMRVFCKYLKEAQLDVHGNPIEQNNSKRVTTFLTRPLPGSLSYYLEDCERGF